MTIEQSVSHILSSALSHASKKYKEQERVKENPKTVADAYFLRPSMFPYCPTEHALRLLTRDFSSMNARKLYYTSVGTTTHSVLQEVLAKYRTLGVYGKWKCRECGTDHKARLSTDIVQCKSCGSHDIEYVEMELFYRRRMRGHIDGIIYVKSGPAKGWWIIDWKTTSDAKLKGKIVPSISYEEQQKTYVVLTRLKLKLPVRGYALVYVSRSDPFSNMKSVVKVMDSKERASWLRVMKRRLKQHRDFLTAGSTTALTETIAQNRMCQSMAHHNEMHEYEGCKYKDVCLNGDKRLARFVREESKDIKLPLIRTAPKSVRDQFKLE